MLKELRDAATSNRDLGDKFERLIASYLIIDPLYKEKYSDVWLWNEWPSRGNQPDTGIDLVAKERYTDEYCAIQCKFYDPTHTLQKSDIDSFFTASGKKPFTSRMIVSTTDKWSNHAEEALANQHIPVARLRVQDLANSPVDWSQFSIKRPQEMKLKEKKILRDHQMTALEKVIEGLKEADRGQMIMACGTGKTFTSLRIAEALAVENALSNDSTGKILFLVPSISLLSQTLREWTSEAKAKIHSFVVCSDTKVGKKSESEDIDTHDLAFPATTDSDKLVHQVKDFVDTRQPLVVFSTYQSIQVVAEAQSKGLTDFDLIICDEAHRTTGVTLANEDESHFVRVHDQGFIKAKKRLYMTATPRLYSDGSKTKAKENDAILCSMDDVGIYGKELYRLGFAEAVGKGLLSDYKVMVLAVDEKYVNKTFQSQIADTNNEINLDDAVKITGCWNGLSKRMTDWQKNEIDTTPMHRAVAFSRSIKDSKRITELFSQIVEEYRQQHQDDLNSLTCEVEHVDGTFNALKRNEKLDWLKEDTTEQGNVCRILSNARCLSEGVDVPALDAVMFLNPRNSVVDVVQSVGRVMRRAEGKQYGYIVLPIGIPAEMAPEDALADNQRYKVVWQVLQALRAHDDRFNATVNQIELNKKRPTNIQIIGVGETRPGNSETGDGKSEPRQLSINFPNLDDWRDAIYAKIVLRCGDRQYWESWAKDVAKIAERHTTRIKVLLEGSDPEHRNAFYVFLQGLRDNLNPTIDEDDAIEMLSQHLITKPVFDALFEGYQFTQHNPVSISMEKMLNIMEGQALEKETASLERFYASVKERATGIDNTAGKQRIVVELYNKFFRTAFPRMAERLGIVYTPVEVVDYIIRSVNDALRQEFDSGLSDNGVHILDPFTGTGTFIVRLLQSGLIRLEDLEYKYKNELHANEIMLLAYYIAAINVEETYHGLTGGEYQPFDGIVLTDTYQMNEGKGTLAEKMFPENNQRVALQNKSEIRVIIGNPPYSAKQSNENEGNKNLKYPQLDETIRNTYAKYSTATNKNNLYDSYIRSIRWASDRIKDNGIVCYVSNGSYIESNSMDGMRKCLEEEFTSIYFLNLRGNARISGEQRRKEGGNVFGDGTRTPIAITLFIKNPAKKGTCELFYHDIGDYLSREEKLKNITEFGSFRGIKWQKLFPNSVHDWINKRDPVFDNFVSIGDRKDKTTQMIFNEHSNGLLSSRDAWIYNFSRNKLTSIMQRMIDFYNSQVDLYQKHCSKLQKNKRMEIDKFIDNDPKKISWSSSLKTYLERYLKFDFSSECLIHGSYRPYCKQWFYFDNYLNHRVSQLRKIFPTNEVKNLVICVSGPAASKDFSALISDCVPNFHFHDTGQCFPLFIYERLENLGGLFKGETSGNYVKKENISDFILYQFTKTYDTEISKEDIFYYIYGILHSTEYKNRFASDLKKMLPRIPLAQDFWAFSKAGRELAQWHLNYEIVEPYPLQEQSSLLEISTRDYYKVSKMRFAKQAGKVDKTTIVYNSNITLHGIPLDTYDYIVNGKSALEWIMERYQVATDKDSLIINDPNDWSDNPQYILNLVKRIVRVSHETIKIVEALPGINERTL